MAKGSQFWGNASGKLGEQVLYRAGGEQRARTYVAKIKNPRSFSQMKNRLLMLNVVSAFRVLKPLLSESFPTRKSNQSAFNAFVQANKNTNGFYISKEDLESGACVPFGMQISRGTLGMSLNPRLEKIEWPADSDATAQYGWVVDGLLDFAGFEYTAPKDADHGDQHYYTPTDDELAKIMKACCIVALPSQFQLSLVQAGYAADDADLNQDIWQPSFTVFHLQENSSYSRTYGMQTSWPKAKIYFRVANIRKDGSGNNVYTFDKVIVGSLSLTANNAAEIANGLILSFKEAGKVNVSNSRVGLIPTKVDGESVQDPTADFREGGFYFEQVMEAYGYKTEGVLASTVSDKPTSSEPEEEPEPEIPDA